MFGMGDFFQSIKINITGENGLNKPVKAAIGDLNRLKKTGETMKSIGKGMMITGAVMAASLVPGIVQAANFETALSEVSTLVDTNVTDMSALSTEIKRLSGDFGSLPVATTKAFYQTISAGFGEAADASTVMTAALKLAKGGVTDTFTAVDGLTSVLNAYGLKAGDATSVSDSFFVAVRAGKTTVGELASSLGRVAPLAASANVSLDDMNAAVATLTTGGLKTAEAVTSLRGIIGAIIKPTSEATKMAKQLGIDFSVGGVKAAGGLAGFLDIVKAKSGGASAALGKLFTDKESLVGALALLGEQSGKYADILGQMGMKAGATDLAFAKMDATTTAAFDKSKANLVVALVSVFEGMLPALTSIANVAGSVFQALGNFSQAHPGITKVGVALFALSSFLLIVGGAALFLTGQMFMAAAAIATFGVAEAGATATTGIFATALKVLGASFWSALGPIGWVILGIAALVAIGVVLVKNWDSIAAGASAAWGGVVAAFKWAGDWMVSFWTNWWPLILGGLLGPFGMAVGLIYKYWDEIVAVAGNAWGRIKGVFDSAWIWVKAFWSEWGAVIVGAMFGPFGIAAGLVVKYWESIKTSFFAGITYIQTLFTGIVGWFTGLPSALYEAGAGMIDAFKQGIISKWGELKTTLTEMFGWVRDFLPGSDAKIGPLKELTASGKAFLPTFGEGVKAGLPVGRRSVDTALSDLFPQGPGGSVNTDGTGTTSAPVATSRTSDNRTINIVLSGDVYGDGEGFEARITDILTKALSNALLAEGGTA